MAKAMGPAPLEVEKAKIMDTQEKEIGGVEYSRAEKSLSGAEHPH